MTRLYRGWIRPRLYSEPGKTKAASSFPNEMISKKFTASLVMRALEGEKCFIMKKFMQALLAAPKKRR